MRVRYMNQVMNGLNECKQYPNKTRKIVFIPGNFDDQGASSLLEITEKMAESIGKLRKWDFAMTHTDKGVKILACYGKPASFKAAIKKHQFGWSNRKL